jgi:hypothetical protein
LQVIIASVYTDGVRRAASWIVLLAFASLTLADVVSCPDGCRDLAAPAGWSAPETADHPHDTCPLCLNSAEFGYSHPQFPNIAQAADPPLRTPAPGAPAPAMIEHPPRG